jgi:hypothetical protein
LQTNDTLLTGESGVFLKENGFLLGISIDGPPAMHEAYRVNGCARRGVGTVRGFGAESRQARRTESQAATALIRPALFQVSRWFRDCFPRV